MRKKTLTIWKSSRNDKFYWRLRASNGRITADSGEGYSRRKACEKQARKDLNMKNVVVVHA